MAVPKTTQTRYMDGSLQATQRTTQVTPSLHLFLNRTCTCIQALLSDYCKQLCADNKYEKKDVGMRLLLPSLHPCTFLEIVFKLWVSIERTLGHMVQHMHVHVPANFILNFTKLPAD